MPRSFTLKNQVLTIVCASLIGLVGCGKKSADESESAQATTPGQTVPTTVSPNAITGIWFGSASLNKTKLQAKIAALTPEEQNLVAAKANTFLSTIMAMEFRPDGTVENEVELQSLDGQVLRDGSTGQWKVVEAKPDGLLVETSEQRQDGTTATNEVFYRFSENGNQIALSVPVCEELEGCESMVVFERRTLESTPTNVAAGTTGTLTK